MTKVTLRKIERGDGDVFEFIIGVLPLLMLTFLIAGVAIIRPLQLPVWNAARECARMASATLDPARGVTQGVSTGMSALSRSLFGGVSGGAITVNYTPSVAGKTNARGHFVTCTATYEIDMTSLPIAGDLFGVVPFESRVTMRVEPIKSDWLAK
jgi:hypothetical protein